MTNPTSPRDLPPFSGDNPTCPKCGHTDAATSYCPDRMLCLCADTPLGERLCRECRRCAYKWDEAIVEPGGEAQR